MKRMMGSTKVVSLVVLVLLLAMVPLAGIACGNDDISNAETITIVMQTPYAETDVTGLMGKKFKELVEEKTDGRVVVDLYFNGTLMDHNAQFEGLRTGALDAAVQNAGYSRPINPNFDFSGQLQGLLLTQTHGEAVYSNETYREFITDLFEVYNIHFVDYIASYQIFGYFANFEIDSLYDLAGKKIYLGRPGALDPANKMLGASEQVYVPMTDLANAVKNGQIDVQLTPATIAAQYGSLAMFKHVLLRPFYNTNLLLISEAKWKAISEEDQGTITNQVMPEVLDYTNGVVIEQHVKALEGIKAAMTTLHVEKPSEEEAMWADLQNFTAFTTLANTMDKTIYNLIKGLRPTYSDYDPSIKAILDGAGISYSL